MLHNQVDITGFIKDVESMKFNSKQDVEILKTLNEAVEAMLVYAMILNLSNN